MSLFIFSSLSRAHGEPLVSGRVKHCPEDFLVDELMPVDFSGDGEHLWIRVQKLGCNTDWLAQAIAKAAGLKASAVSYAGLKDRHAITTQWFSLHLPGLPDPDLTVLDSDEVKILKSVRHNRKLKRGALSGNCFKLRIRDLIGDVTSLDERLQAISEQGVPNYFGEQRFGFEMSNIDKALAMFQGQLRRLKKNKRSLFLSAARSWIFNQVLSQRVRDGNWNNRLAGDAFMLAGKSACFVDDASENLVQRLSSREIHPTGPLWGKGESMAALDCAELETTIASDNAALAEGLENAGLKQERRALRLMPENMQWTLQDSTTLNLEFCLPSGAYATMVLREFMDQEVA